MFPFPFSFFGAGEAPPPPELELIDNNFAMSFDAGSSEYIDCGNDSSLQVFQNSHTHSFWIKYTGTVQGYIGGYGVDSVVIFHGSDRIRFYTKGLTSGADFYSMSTLSDNEWYHIACTYELNGDKKIYINGVLDNTVSTSGTITSEGVAYTIGARNLNSTIDNYFDGDIDEVAIWNRALELDDVQTIYNATNNNPGKCANLWSGGLGTGLVYWNRMGD